MPNAPWSRPAAPTPARARPVIKASEDGAEAQTADPTNDHLSQWRRQKQILYLTFKNDNGRKEHVLGVEVLVTVGRYWCNGGEGHEVGSSIPSDIVQGMKLSRDFGRSNGYDGCIERHECGAKHQREHDDDEFDTCRILRHILFSCNFHNLFGGRCGGHGAAIAS